MKNPAIKRILSEIKEMTQDTSSDYAAVALEDNIFEWHFTIRGPKDTEFEGGRYHGRIILPAEYPFKPPAIIFLTPNGRFEVGKKICLTITGHHPEFWQPAWGIRTALLAIISFFPTKSEGAIGGLDWNKDERQKLAKKSQEWRCPACGKSALRDENTGTMISDKDKADLAMFSFSYEKETAVAGSSKQAGKEAKVTDDQAEIAQSPVKEQETAELTTKEPATSATLRQRAQVHSSTTSVGSTPSTASRQTRVQHRRTNIDAMLAFVLLIAAFLIIRRLVVLIGL